MEKLSKELFEIGEPGSKRVYKFIGLGGLEKETSLSFGEYLISKRRCLSEGCFIVARDGDPHMIPECPICVSDGEYEDKSIAEIENLLKTSLNPIVRANLEKIV